MTSTGTGKEEGEEVKAALADFVEAWNRHDAKAFSRAERVTVTIWRACGRHDQWTSTAACLRVAGESGPSRRSPICCRHIA